MTTLVPPDELLLVLEPELDVEPELEEPATPELPLEEPPLLELDPELEKVSVPELLPELDEEPELELLLEPATHKPFVIAGDDGAVPLCGIVKPGGPHPPTSGGKFTGALKTGLPGAMLKVQPEICGSPVTGWLSLVTVPSVLTVPPS